MKVERKRMNSCQKEFEPPFKEAQICSFSDRKGTWIYYHDCENGINITVNYE